MAKTHDAKKNDKKAPLKTAKEKKQGIDLEDQRLDI